MFLLFSINCDAILKIIVLKCSIFLSASLSSGILACFLYVDLVGGWGREKKENISHFHFKYLYTHNLNFFYYVDLVIIIIIIMSPSMVKKNVIVTCSVGGSNKIVFALNIIHLPILIKLLYIILSYEQKFSVFIRV